MTDHVDPYPRVCVNPLALLPVPGWTAPLHCIPQPTYYSWQPWLELNLAQVINCRRFYLLPNMPGFGEEGTAVDHARILNFRGVIWVCAKNHAKN